jgi:hypothetical protein
MAIATILGAIAIHRYVAALSEMLAPDRIRLATVLVLGFMLVLSTAVLFPSPYIYQTTGQVSDDRISGYETAFNHQNRSVEMFSVREGPWRFRDAIAGVEGVDSSRNEQQGYYGENLSRIRTLSPEDRYFIHTGADVIRELEVFNGLRFTPRQFGSLSRQPGVHRVQASDGVFVHYVEGLNNSSAPPQATRASPQTNRPSPRVSRSSSQTSRSPSRATRGPPQAIRVPPIDR